jgi:hypothetical protein
MDNCAVSERAGQLYRFTFVDIATDKKAYRVTTVVATDVQAARKALVAGDGWVPLVGEPKPSSARPGRKSKLYTNRDEMAKAMGALGVTIDQVDEIIREAIRETIHEIGKAHGADSEAV